MPRDAVSDCRMDTKHRGFFTLRAVPTPKTELPMMTACGPDMPIAGELPGANRATRASALNLAPADGEVYLFRGFLGADKAARWLAVLQAELAWQQEWIVIAGKRVLVPRRVCWYGDEGAVYRYSGVDHQPLCWTSGLLELKQGVERFLGFTFNSVLCNHYRDGTDSMGWHADKEKELGRDPVIASLSLGATRRFLLRHNKTRESLALDLASGSLLLMQGALQHHWRHCVPKDPQCREPRINLTFRRINP